MPNGRKRIAAVSATLIALVTALVGVGLGVVTESATAKPDLETAKKLVDKYEHLAEQASERYNDASVKLATARTTLDALNADLTRQDQVVAAMRQQVATMVVDQYQGDALSTTSQVVLSNNPDAFLNNLNAVSAYNNQRGQVMKEFSTQLDRLKLRKAAVKAEADRLTSLQQTMAQEKAQVDDKAAKAKAVLDGLEAAARAKLLAGNVSSSVIPTDVPASGRAAAAVRFAMAQVGKAYVYGGSGPNAYDCSGLTMRAWGAAGVGLPHSAAAQQGMGTRVSESQLQPGDLVFYYSPVSHVGMYIGHGMIVNALNPGEGVRVSPLHMMPYSGAVRPG